MEALTAFGVHWKLLVIQMVNFTLLLALLYYFAYKPILGMLESREKKITESVLRADEIAHEHKSLKEERAKVLKHAHEEGNEVIAQLKKDAEARNHASIHDAHEKGESIIAEAHKKAEDARAHLLRESEKELAKIAILAAEKVLRERTN